MGSLSIYLRDRRVTSLKLDALNPFRAVDLCHSVRGAKGSRPIKMLAYCLEGQIFQGINHEAWPAATQCGRSLNVAGPSMWQVPQYGRPLNVADPSI
jgi:hypothetical protein